MYFSWLFHYISSGTSLLLTRSSFQHPLIRCPQNLCWFTKGYIWNYWTLWLCWPSGSFFEITLTDPKQSRLSLYQNFHTQSLNKEEYCCPNYIFPIKTRYLSVYAFDFDHVSIVRLKICQEKFSWFGSQQIYLTWKVIFIIQTYSTWFHVKLILHPLHSAIQQFMQHSSSVDIHN